MQRIYLDHAATTPLDERVLAAMMPHLTGSFGNPSSMYAEGRAARKALDHARRIAASALGAAPREIIFTSGGSESDTLAIQGVIGALGGKPHVITSAIEHHAVLHAVQSLERAGAIEATYLPVDGAGVVAVADLEAALRPGTALLSVMTANNETGAIQPIAALSRAARRRNPGIVVHTDAVQAAGWLDLDVDRLGVDLLSVTAHKIYGPRGAGLLYARTGVRLAPLIHGGGQEGGRRAGTENVAGAVGLAEALRWAAVEREARTQHAMALRSRLLARLTARIPQRMLNSPNDAERCLPGMINLSIPGVESEPLLQYLDLNGVAASSGAACTTGALEPSHVLLAMGRDEVVARNSLRLSLGRDSTEENLDRAVELVAAFAARAASMR